MARGQKVVKNHSMDEETNHHSGSDYPELNTLDIFAIFASIGLTKRETDPQVIARESYRIASEMKAVSDSFK